MGTDRRTFIKTVGLALGALFGSLTPILRSGAAFGARKVQGFRFEHEESVAIVLGLAKKSDRYDVTVRKDGEDVEFFANVEPMHLHRLDTQHFEVQYFDPVAA